MSQQPRLALYMSESCGYCRHVLTALEPLGLDVELRNIHRDPGARDELVAATGRGTVPVLRIQAVAGEEPVWMPESLDIIRELQRHAGVEPKVPVWVDRALGFSRPLGLGLVVAAVFMPGPASDIMLWSGAGILVLGILRRFI